MKPRNSLCILGAGPAALLSQAFLREKGCNPVVVADSVLGNLKPMRYEGVRVGMVPIFPFKESELFQRIAWEPPVAADRVSVTFAPGSEDLPDAISPGSHAEFIANNFSDSRRRLILAKKHVGTGVFTRGFPELRRKVVANYPQIKRERTLVGFAEGVSFYLRYIERGGFTVSVRERVLEVDVANRRVVTNSREIRYERLISTLPISDLVRVAGIQTGIDFVGEGAQIAVAMVREPLEPNRIIYDCDAQSPIYRAFVPRGGFVVAQVARGHWEVDPGIVAKRIEQLFGLAATPLILRRFTINNCYPLAVSDYALKDELVHHLESSGITLFGRGAQWEYVDLDELEWGRIDSLQ